MVRNGSLFELVKYLNGEQHDTLSYSDFSFKHIKAFFFRFMTLFKFYVIAHVEF